MSQNNIHNRLRQLLTPDLKAIFLQYLDYEEGQITTAITGCDIKNLPVYQGKLKMLKEIRSTIDNLNGKAKLQETLKEI